ncbi:MAG: LPS assembly protein LptD [Chromatiales bacterium]|nr:LPS assembly protein LptD [Chromatiales bacterium]
MKLSRLLAFGIGWIAVTSGRVWAAPDWDCAQNAQGRWDCRAAAAPPPGSAPPASRVPRDDRTADTADETSAAESPARSQPAWPVARPATRSTFRGPTPQFESLADDAEPARAEPVDRTPPPPPVRRAPLVAATPPTPSTPPTAPPAVREPPAAVAPPVAAVKPAPPAPTEPMPSPVAEPATVVAPPPATLPDSATTAVPPSPTAAETLAPLAAVETPLIAQAGPETAPVELIETQPTVDAPRPDPLALESAPWNACGPVRGVKLPKVDEQARANAPLRLSANATQRDAAGRTEFEGAVRGERADQTIAADRAVYDPVSGRIDASGNVQYRDAIVVIDGATANMDLGADRGAIESATYRLFGQNTRGEASRAELQSRTQSRYENFTYTSCRPGNEDWVLRADELEIDTETGIGVARRAKVEFLGVPMIYAPYASFPIDDRRKSGVLLPSIAYSDRNGVDITVPYYLNLAPNYDATLYPRVLSERGAMLGAEFRYLGRSYEGELAGEILPSDNDHNNDTRGQIALRHKQNFLPNLRLNIDAANVSDDDYVDDFGDSLSVASERLISRRASLTYLGNGFTALARVDDYQTVDPTNTLVDPYSKLPQVRFELADHATPWMLHFGGHADWTAFDHPDFVTGKRLDVAPWIALPYERPWGWVTPKLAGRYTAYDLTDQAPGLDDNPDRTLFTASLDSGLIFERDTNWFGSAYTQTLEPRAFYLYTPYRDQTDIPDFDAALLDFSFPALFAENRFAGTDRIGDANQVSLGITSRLIDPRDGAERLRLALGEIIYFADRRVQLPGVAEVEDSTSDTVAELSARITNEVSVRSALQWNNDDSEFYRAAAAVHYRDDDGLLLNAAYRYRRDLLDQADFSARVPVGQRWNLVGRGYWSFDDDDWLEVFGGLEYDACCWRTRVVVRRYVTDDGADHNLGVMLQLELKGLSSIGERIDHFLEKGIYGYEVEQ